MHSVRMAVRENGAHSTNTSGLMSSWRSSGPLSGSRALQVRVNAGADGDSAGLVCRAIQKHAAGYRSSREVEFGSAETAQRQGPSRGETMSIEDKLAIQEMVAKYSYAYDSNDAEGFAQLFVEDGVFEAFVPGQTTASVRLQSRTGIREWAAHRLQERSGRFTSRHYQSGLLFDGLTSDAALTRTMVLVTHQGVDEAAPRPTISGVYHDQWRKTHTGWRLAHRAAHVDRDPGFSK